MLHARRILLIHGGGLGNAGDDGQALAAARRLERMVPEAEVVLGRMYASEDASCFADRPRAPTPHLCFNEALPAVGRGLCSLLVRFRMRPAASLVQKTVMVVRALRLLAAAAIWRCLGRAPGIGRLTRDVISAMAACDAVYNSGGGNLNDMWFRQELLPRAVTWRMAHLLGKPVYVSGQGVGPLKRGTARRVLRWGLRHVRWFTCRDREESAAELSRLGFGSDRVASLGDDALDLEACDATRVEEILAREGVASDGPPCLAVHVRLHNFSTCFRDEGVAPMAGLLDRLVDRLSCRIIFIPITHAKHAAYDQDIGDAFDVYAQMRNRYAAHFVCGRYLPGEIKGVVGACRGLVGFSYHAWVFALSCGLPAFALYHGEYFRLKAEGLFAWYDRMNWVFEITRDDSAAIEAAVTAAVEDEHLSSFLRARTEERVMAIAEPARRLARELVGMKGGGS